MKKERKRDDGSLSPVLEKKTLAKMVSTAKPASTIDMRQLARMLESTDEKDRLHALKSIAGNERALMYIINYDCTRPPWNLYKPAFKMLVSMVGELTSEEALVYVARYSKDKNAGKTAVERLAWNEKTLMSIKGYSAPRSVLEAVFKKLISRVGDLSRDTLWHICEHSENVNYRKIALERISDPVALKYIAINARYLDTALAALKMLYKEEGLVAGEWLGPGSFKSDDVIEVTKKSENDEVIRAAIEMLRGNTVALIKVATTCYGKAPVMAVESLSGNLAALKKLFGQRSFNNPKEILIEELAKMVNDLSEADTDILVQIAEYSKNKDARIAAVEKISDPSSLYSIAIGHKDAEITRIAIEKLSSNVKLLKNLAAFSLNNDTINAAIAKLDNADDLIEVIKHEHSRSEAGQAAEEKLRSLGVDTPFAKGLTEILMETQV